MVIFPYAAKDECLPSRYPRTNVSIVIALGITVVNIGNPAALAIVRVVQPDTRCQVVVSALNSQWASLPWAARYNASDVSFKTNE